MFRLLILLLVSVVAVPEVVVETTVMVLEATLEEELNIT